MLSLSRIRPTKKTWQIFDAYKKYAFSSLFVRHALKATFIQYPVEKGRTYQHIVPVIEISYLARDRKWKRRNLGIRLVLQALSVALDVQDKISGFAGVQLTTTDKGRHLYTAGSVQFDPHPAANTDADFYMRIQDARAIMRGDEALI